MLDSLSISVADCGGVENLPDFARLCRQLGIPYLVVTDGDASKAAINERVAKRVMQLRGQVEADPEGLYFAFAEDLEAALKLPAKGFDHAVRTAETLVLKGKQVLEEVVGLLNALDAFLLRVAPGESSQAGRQAIAQNRGDADESLEGTTERSEG